MSHLHLYLLAAPRLERNGEPVSIDTRKAIALLAYLSITAVVNGTEMHTRDELAALFWPELDQTRARAALRRTLSPLRQALAKNVLTVTRETIGMNADADLWVDVRTFRRLLAEAADCENKLDDARLKRLTSAVELYRDHFMSGFSLRDAPAFDEWQFFIGEQLQREVVAALDELVQAYGTCAKYDLAIRYAHRRLSLDPLSEQAHRNLMQLYAWAGQRNAALRQYRECVRILEQELGVPPLEETITLYEQILADTVKAPAPLREAGATKSGVALPVVTEPAFAPIPSRELPLVGREQEVNTMQASYRHASKKGHFLVLEGEAGVGKTRLAETFVHEAPGWIIRARCYEGESDLALGLFVEVLRNVVEQAPEGWQEDLPTHWLSEVGRLLPELAREAPLPRPLAGPGAQSRFFEAVSQFLLALMTSRAPEHDKEAASILFIDDVHWADNASLDLLVYLVRRFQDRPLLILVTWRSEALGAGHPLRALLADAQRHGQGTVLTLRRLGPDEVRELVQALPAGEHKWPEGLDEQLYRETEGLPFFITEYLKALATAHEPSWEMPRSVRELLNARLAAVDPIGRQFLQTAAVIGRSFDFDICRLASGRSEEEAVAALEQLLARELISEVSSGSEPQAPLYDFTHSQIRNLAYKEMSLARQRLLHRRVAEALAQRNRNEALSGQIAHHYRLAGLEAEAAEAFKRAGEQARRLYANAEALAHLRTALALGHPDVAALHEALGDLQTLLGHYEGALRSYEAASALALPVEQPRLEHKLGNVYRRSGAWQRAENHYQAALNAAPLPDTAQQARIYADWSLSAHYQHETERALALAQEARSLAEQVGDHLALAQAFNILGVLSRHEKKIETAIAYLQKSLSLAKASESPTARIAALNNLALAYVDQQEAERALALLQEALQLCVTRGDRHREAALHNNMADLHYAAGRAQQAMDHLKQAAAIFSEIGGESKQWQPEIWMLTEW